MNIYLAIITTVLVLTQIVRLIQNAIHLHRQEKAIAKDLAWIKDNDISERDSCNLRISCETGVTLNLFECGREIEIRKCKAYEPHKRDTPTIIPAEEEADA